MAELFPGLGHGQGRGPGGLGAIVVTGAEDDLVDVPGPTSWPEVPSADAPDEWEDLRSWVGELCRRFPSLDHHVVPRCWWRHNEHVEALVALRDHERSSFAAASPATAPVEWLRALRDVASLQRSWTAELGCGASHRSQPTTPRPVDAEEWARFVANDVVAREAKEVEQAVR
jgi:hypothetical protein